MVKYYHKKVTEQIRELEEGKSVTVTARVSYVRTVCSRMGGYTVTALADGMCRVTRLTSEELKERKPSRMSAILRHCRSCSGEPVYVSYPVDMVRPVLTYFNRRAGRKLKARKSGDQACTIYEELEDRQWITQSEYDSIKAEYQARLNELKKRIRVQSDDDDII